MVDDFPNGFDDLKLVTYERPYKQQDWKLLEERSEFIEVYIYECFEKNQAWSSYYSTKDEYYWKCSESQCLARMEIVTERSKGEGEEDEEKK